MSVCDAHEAVFSAVKQMPAGEGYLLAARYVQTSVIQEKFLQRNRATAKAMGLSPEEQREAMESLQGASPWLLREECIAHLPLGQRDKNGARDAARRWWRDQSTPGYAPRNDATTAAKGGGKPAPKSAMPRTTSDVPAQTIRFRCPGCSKVIVSPMELAGRAARCPKCKARIAVPEARPESSQRGDSKEAEGPALSGMPKTLEGSSEATARGLVADQLDTDRLETDEAYRTEMMNNSLLLGTFAQTSLQRSRHPEAAKDSPRNNCRSHARQSVESRRLATAATAKSDTYFSKGAKAIEESLPGLVIVVGGWDQFARGCAGLQLTFFKLTMIGYYVILQHAVRTFGLGELGPLEKFDEAEMVGNIVSISDTMKGILGQIKTQQQQPPPNKQKGWFGTFIARGR